MIHKCYYYFYPKLVDAARGFMWSIISYIHSRIRAKVYGVCPNHGETAPKKWKLLKISLEHVSDDSEQKKKKWNNFFDFFLKIFLSEFSGFNIEYG